jgi:hypothetical protein
MMRRFEEFENKKNTFHLLRPKPLKGLKEWSAK